MLVRGSGDGRYSQDEILRKKLKELLTTESYLESYPSCQKGFLYYKKGMKEQG